LNSVCGGRARSPGQVYETPRFTSTRSPIGAA
jgi:hypothetical protein